MFPETAEVVIPDTAVSPQSSFRRLAPAEARVIDIRGKCVEAARDVSPHDVTSGNSVTPRQRLID